MPGDVLCKEINLTDGFATFHYGAGHGRDHSSIVLGGWEYDSRYVFPDEVSRISISVQYWIARGGIPAFEKWFGCDPRGLGILPELARSNEIRIAF
jgi:hypothetical protein